MFYARAFVNDIVRECGETKMVIVKIMGGLGNQMFQYAFARSLEVKNGHTVILDLSYYENQPDGDTVRKEFISTFPHKFKKATQEQIICLRNRDRQIWNRFLGKAKLYRSNLIQENEAKGWSYEFQRDQIYLTGYWQSETYFKDISEIIRAEFDFSGWTTDKKSAGVLQSIRECEVSAAVHVRAGDYLKKENFDCFGNICTEHYYREACQYILHRYPQCRFFLFTDDADWVKKNIKLSFTNMEIVENSEDKKEWTDLFLMSRCSHNVIANSSYSWWAAWLNPHQNKIVVAPERWTNFNINQHTICDEWVRIYAE